METISIERASPSARVERRIIREASPTELIYISTGTTVVSRSRIAGAVNRTQFETAVAHLEGRYGILRSAVEDGKFVRRLDRSCSIEAWLSSETSSADAIYAKLLNAELDTSACVYRIHVIAAADSLDVFLLSSHAIGDATSLIELHACLAHICDCVVRNEAPLLDRQAFPDPIDAAVRNALNSLPANQTVGGPTSISGPFAEIASRGQRNERPLTHRLERIVIDAEDTHLIGAAGHAHGSSVHAMLLAAFALAIRETAPGRPRQILMRSNVDLRRRLEPHVSTEWVFSAISARVTPIADLDRPLFEIARHIFDDIHEACADGSVFREYINYPKSFGSPQQAPIALSVSDMQTVNFRWPTEQLSVAGFEYALGWQKKYPNVSVSVYEGTLVANIVYVEEFIDPMVMRTISERFVKLLASASRSSQGIAAGSRQGQATCPSGVA
jgi:hypothetical protein